jgi:hypothetical protein
MERTKEREALWQKFEARIMQSSIVPNSLSPSLVDSSTTQHHATATFHQAENLQPQETVTTQHHAIAAFDLNEKLESQDRVATEYGATGVSDMGQNVGEIKIGNYHFNWMPRPSLNTVHCPYTPIDFGDDFHMLPQDSDQEGENTPTTAQDSTVDFATDQNLLDALNYVCDSNDFTGGICDVFTEKENCESTPDLKSQIGTSDKNKKEARKEETPNMKRTASPTQESTRDIALQRAMKRVWKTIGGL